MQLGVLMLKMLKIRKYSIKSYEKSMILNVNSKIRIRLDLVKHLMKKKGKKFYTTFR